MKVNLHLTVALCLLVVGFAAARTWEDGDTIIIDPSVPDHIPRLKRDQELVGDEFRKEDEDTVLIRSDRCITARGKSGQCMTFLECYPLLGPIEQSDGATFNDPLADQLIAASGLCSGVEYRSDSPEMLQKIASSEMLICCAPQSRVAPPLPPSNASTVEDASSNSKSGCGILKIDTHILPSPEKEDTEALNRTNNGIKIVNGREAQRGEFPWIVALMNNGRQFCGGSLIDAKTVLTAAHCVQHLSAADVQRLTIQIGDHDIYSTADGQHEVRTASRIYYHKGFSMQHLHHDVALILLNKPATLGTYMQTVCMHSGSPNTDHMNGDVAGWGQLRDGGAQPSKLRTANVKIWTNADCSRKYGRDAPAGIGAGMICAGGGGKDSCRGDSGGPLTINSRSKAQIVGIVSFGIGCGSYPGVYTRVEKYTDWINKNRKRTFAE